MHPTKNSDYYSAIRKEITPLLPTRAARTLDVGCGHGVTGEYLKQLKITQWVSGLEYSPQAAEVAKTRLDEVICADLNFLAALPFEEESFDLILCLDVLEHLINPWQTLALLTKHLKSGGTIILSVPNIRNFRVVLPLLLKGEFQYQEAGILDSTHLRFFTKKSAVELATSSGLKIERILRTGAQKGAKTWFLNIATFGLFRDFFTIQYLIELKK